MSHVYQNCQRADLMNEKSKHCSDEHFQKLIGILVGFYTAGQIKKPGRQCEEKIIFKWQPSKLLRIWIFGAVTKVGTTEKNYYGNLGRLL